MKRGRAAWKDDRPRNGKLLCRACGDMVKHSGAWSVNERQRTCICIACKERADELRDTGWEILRTQYGVRYHREFGSGLQLDVEQAADGLTWTAAASRGKRLTAIRCGCATAEAAAEAIEIAAQCERRPLPDPDPGEGGTDGR